MTTCNFEPGYNFLRPQPTRIRIFLNTGGFHLRFRKNPRPHVDQVVVGLKFSILRFFYSQIFILRFFHSQIFHSQIFSFSDFHSQIFLFSDFHS